MKEIAAFFAVLGLDLGTKHWAEKSLPLDQKKEVVKNHLCLWHIKNGGMAYNTLDGKRKGILFLTGGLLAIYAWLFGASLTGRMPRKFAMPIALTLGGGMGNFLERLKKGSVTDFLYIPSKGRKTPIFNLADIAIVCGAIWVIVISHRKK